MNFSDALICLNAGATVRRSVWFYDALSLKLDLLARPPLLRLRDEAGNSMPWVGVSEDLLADDWELPWNLASLAGDRTKRTAAK